MKFWKEKKRRKKKKAARFTISHECLTIIFFSLLLEDIFASFSSASRLRFTSSIPPSAAEPRGSFCAGFVSMRGQENAARETEAPHQTSQEFSSCFSFPPSSLVLFPPSNKNYRNPFSVTFFPSPFHLPAASQRDQMWKSQNPGI